MYAIDRGFSTNLYSFFFFKSFIPQSATNKQLKNYMPKKNNFENKIIH